MFMLIVDIEVKPKFSEQFFELVLKQAENSLNLEDECHFFEVTRFNENHFVLSEVYTNKTSFDQHLKTNHFLEFDETTKDWISSKSLKSIE